MSKRQHQVAAARKALRAIKPAECISPDKKRFMSIRKAQRVAEQFGQRVYPCGRHWHLTSNMDYRPPSL